MKKYNKYDLDAITIDNLIYASETIWELYPESKIQTAMVDLAKSNGIAMYKEEVDIFMNELSSSHVVYNALDSEVSFEEIVEDAIEYILSKWEVEETEYDSDEYMEEDYEGRSGATNFSGVILSPYGKIDVYIKWSPDFDLYDDEYSFYL